MRSWWGIASLLVALAVVGVATTRQLRSVARVSDIEGAHASSSPSARAGNVAQRSQALQRQVQVQVQDDVTRALAQGAASHAEAADAP